MNQADLRIMAEERLKDAKALLDAGRWAFAYYTTGYSAECGLKSCILARMIYTAWVFSEDPKAKKEDCRTHDLNKLVKLAGLTDELNNELAASAAAGGEFVAHWGTTEKWTSESRYQARTEAEAKELYTAIADDSNGVLQWIRKYW